MKATMEVLSKEIIKPSSPTPHHLRKMKLSYLDHIQAPFYFPIMFFYQAHESTGLNCSNHSQMSQQLKQSLSTTLTSFYPLAGTIDDDDDSNVDCSDAGAEFIEAQVDAHLVDAIQERNMDDLDRYLPMYPTNGKGALLIVKISFFKCGGFSVGMLTSHEVADLRSVVAFVNAWAATCRGKPDYSRFSFNLADYFPMRDSPNIQFLSFADETCSTKRFIFDEETIMILKREAASPMVQDPTRVEAVSAFIWMHIIETAESKTSDGDAGDIIPAFHAVSLRPRTGSLENVFGNCFMITSAFCNANSFPASHGYQDLVSKLRSSIRKIDKDHIAKAQRGDSYLDDLRQLSSMQTKGELMEGCFFSSWCGFPVYEVDYGWGNPTWVCSTSDLGVKKFILLINTKCGKGIEAWVCMENDKLERLDSQMKLIRTNVKNMDD